MGSSKISSGSSLRIRIFLTLGLALTMFQSIRAKPQLDNPINDDWFKNHFDSNFGSDDWFEKKKEENRRDRDEFFKDFDEQAARHQTIFSWVAGIMITIFILILISVACCFFIPACYLAKALTNRRNRSHQGGVVHGTGPVANQPPTSGPGGAYPMQPTASYPYGPSMGGLPPHQAPPKAVPPPSQPPYNPRPIGFNTAGNPPSQMPYNPSFPGGNYPAQQSQTQFPQNPPPYPY